MCQSSIGKSKLLSELEGVTGVFIDGNSDSCYLPCALGFRKGFLQSKRVNVTDGSSGTNLFQRVIDSRYVVMTCLDIGLMNELTLSDSWVCRAFDVFLEDEMNPDVYHVSCRPPSPLCCALACYSDISLRVLSVALI